MSSDLPRRSLLTALASLILHEVVRVQRWIAVTAGFAGVLIVLQPGTDLFKWTALLPLLMAFASALYHVLTPIVTRAEDPAVSIYFLGIFGAVAMSLVIPWFWVDPDMFGWIMLLMIGVLGTAGHLLIVRAFAHAPASVLAPFFYIHLVWATGLRLAHLRQPSQSRDGDWRRADHREWRLHLSNSMKPD